MEAIKISGLTKKYKDVTAVDGLDLAINEGELFALLGVNGAGKTTTIKMLSCLAKPTSGDAFLCGKSIVKESGEVKSVIAVSPQETAVAPNLTVRENLELMAGVHGFTKEKNRKENFIAYRAVQPWGDNLQKGRKAFGGLAETFEHCHGSDKRTENTFP